MTRDEALAARQQLYEQFSPRTGDWVSDGKLIVLRFLQDLFFQAPLEAPEKARQGPSFHWEAEDSRSELIISDMNSLDTDSLGSRPAIIVSRGEFAYGNASIDQLLGVTAKDGKRTHTDLVAGSFVLYCVAPTGRTAEILASYTAKAIRVFRRELQRAGFHLIGTVVTVGKESGAGEVLGADADSKFRMVPVIFPVWSQDAWTVTPQANLLQKISLKVLAVATRFGGGLVDPDSVDEDGRPIEGHAHVTIVEWTWTAEPP